MATRRAESGGSPSPRERSRANYIVDEHYAPRRADPDAATVVPPQRDDHSWVHRSERFPWPTTARLWTSPAAAPAEAGAPVIPRVAGDEGLAVDVRVVDISIGGLSISCETLLSVDETVALLLPVAPDDLRVEARVVWLRAGAGRDHAMGLQIVGVAEGGQERFAALIAELSAVRGPQLSYTPPDFDLVDEPK